MFLFYYEKKEKFHILVSEVVSDFRSWESADTCIYIKSENGGTNNSCICI